MKRENPNERTISNFIEVNGIGTVATKSGYRDVFVYGYFKMWNWWFIIHLDVQYPFLITVSEASTGYRLRDECYYSVEDALHYSIPFIKEKRYYFSTSVGNVLIKNKVNLEKRNTTGLQTLAIDSVLW